MTGDLSDILATPPSKLDLELPSLFNLLEADDDVEDPDNDTLFEPSPSDLDEVLVEDNLDEFSFIIPRFRTGGGFNLGFDDGTLAERNRPPR